MKIASSSTYVKVAAARRPFSRPLSEPHTPLCAYGRHDECRGSRLRRGPRDGLERFHHVRGRFRARIVEDGPVDVGRDGRAQV